MAWHRVLLTFMPGLWACQEEPYTGLVPSEMTCVGAAPVAASTMCIDGDFLFVGNDEGLHALDRRLEPSQMVVGMVGAPDLALPVKAVACRDGRVFVTDAVGLTVFSAGATPSKLGSAASTFVPVDFGPALVVDDRRAYAGLAGFVEMYDITDPAAPSQVGAVDFQDRVVALAHGGDWLAVGSDVGLQAIRIVSPASDDLPTLADLPIGFPIALHAVGEHLYVTRQSSPGTQLHNFDLTDVSAPVESVIFNVVPAPGGEAHDLVVLDDYLFAANSTDGFVAYDIYEPDWVYLDVGRQPCSGFAPLAIAGTGRTLYAATGDHVDVVQ